MIHFHRCPNIPYFDLYLFNSWSFSFFLLGKSNIRHVYKDGVAGAWHAQPVSRCAYSKSSSLSFCTFSSLVSVLFRQQTVRVLSSCNASPNFSWRSSITSTFSGTFWPACLISSIIVSHFFFCSVISLSTCNIPWPKCQISHKCTTLLTSRWSRACCISWWDITTDRFNG